MSERYEIREQIGRGGLGVVYRAFDTQLGRDVAIKRVILDNDESQEELTANLLTEARTLSTLKHPHIVTVHDVGQDADGAFVVMELLEGETLDQIVGRSVLSVEDFGILAVQLLEGIIAAQSVSLLHRDLKPANIMVVWLPSGKFQAKILDFGLAKFSTKPAAQTVDQSDSIFGSIYFMAPEQFERRPLDGRTDLYSLGGIFYYTLTGEYPFQGDTAPEVMASHMLGRYEPLRERRPEVPDSICQWVERLMTRYMTDRPDNAQAALAAWDPAPAIDEDQLREAASGDAELATELLEGFAEEFEELLAQLDRDIDSDELASAEESARTIRGTASTVGYTAIIEIAKEIEGKVSRDPEECRTLAVKFPAALARVRGAVERMKWTEQ